jgi:hypothetical protein
MLVEFRSHPDERLVWIDTSQIRAILRARGGLAYTLIRCSDGMEVVVHGKKEQVVAKLDQTGEGPALRIG